ncbi:MAG TPA: hypothetical protein VMU25_00845 [Candidatus Paceibacterota bacterium]|nr:hypothetical protein [Candidatus Paceibacterota bacterium]
MELKIGGYERDVLRRGGGMEIVEITWPSGTRTRKHNHNAHGRVRVMRGRIFEIRSGKKVYYEAGENFLEIEGDVPHIIGNDSNSVAVTRHIYEPELTMETFEDDANDIAALAQEAPVL